MDQIKIGKFIAQLRKEQGLTQNQLAEKLNISNRTVSKWETGNGLPDVSLLTPLCSVLNITSDELFAGELIPAFHAEEVKEEFQEEAQEEIKEVPKKISKSRIIIIIVAVILILALCFLVTCKLMGNDNKENGLLYLSPSATNVITPNITPTMALTEAPITSDTPEITLTPEITVTPEITITPEITLTPEVITPLITPTAQIIYVTPPIIQTVNPTETPSITPTPILTPTPTIIPTSTLNPTATVKVTPTITPTPIPTPTPTSEPSIYSYRDAVPADDYVANSTIINNAIVITGVERVSNNGTYEIPETIGGKKVVAIMDRAFCDDKIKNTVKKVIIPANVKTINAYAFYQCSNLTDIYIKGEAVACPSVIIPEEKNRNFRITVHASSTCHDRNFRTYKVLCTYWNTDFDEWNG